MVDFKTIMVKLNQLMHVRTNMKNSRLDRRRILDAARESGRRKATSGPSAARSQDFLYDNSGLPKS